MARSLGEIDNVYSEVLLGERQVTDRDRITYCRKAIRKATYVLEMTRRYLSDTQRRQYIEVISAADREIRRLRYGNTSSPQLVC